MISQMTPAGIEAGEPREVDRRLGLAGADEHAAVARAQREDVAGLDEVVRRRGGVDRDVDRVRAVGRGDAGRHALARFDRDRERGAEARLVPLASSAAGRARRSARR